MPSSPIPPKEKARLRKFLHNIRILSRRSKLTQQEDAYLKMFMRAALKILGAKYPDRVMVSRGIEIVRDYWPMKIKRLEKLINQ